MTTGGTLRMLRESKNMSIQRLAGMAEVSTSVVFGAERDKAISLPTLQTIVCNGLGMKLSKFFDIVEKYQNDPANWAQVADPAARKARKVADRAARKARKVAA